ncbi:hypothetical protein Cgig2_009457 [Carnegiea gigantea]|uniref:DNA-directed RNA polymerase RpoA/D/Rpb3-type domain-containing protein n=1 Tax=Carnegiea gigantea TaxID=171969 RepID=A0A9Q1QD40_9CARY|nr:hypothetical protein Cgig2_009457 [Carnegiea gigantea]
MSRPSFIPYGNLLTHIFTYFKIPLDLEDCVTEPVRIISANSVKTLRFYKTTTGGWKHVFELNTDGANDEATALRVHLPENSSLATLVEGLERLREVYAELRTRVDIIHTEMGPFSRKLDDLIRMTSLVHHGVKLAEIELEAHAVKGVGKEHAKWSPVATAWYKMLPEVVLLKDIFDEKAEELVKRCPANVFDIEDTPTGRKATAPRPRACTLCRECVLGEGWDEMVALRRKRDHFIFTIESTGALPPEQLFTEAVKILEDKCARFLPIVEQLERKATLEQRKTGMLKAKPTKTNCLERAKEREREAKKTEREGMK